MKFLSLTLLLWCVTINDVTSLKGSCRAMRKCCDGKDADCVVQKTPINAIMEDLSDEPCYCDHGCLDVGDCCPDFKDYCGGKSICDVIYCHFHNLQFSYAICNIWLCCQKR